MQLVKQTWLTLKLLSQPCYPPLCGQHTSSGYIYVSNFFFFFVETFSDVCIMDVHTQPQVQRQRFRWQASGSEEHPSESLLEEGPVGVCVFDCVCVWSRLSTHPSLEWRRCLRPGGRGRTRRASTPDGSSLRSREQHRYCREVGAETERITFMLLLAAVEHAIGKTRLFFISVAATPSTHT